MKQKKTIFSYVLWLVYALPVTLMLGYVIYQEALIMKLRQQWQLVLAVIVLSVIVFFDYYFIALGIKFSNRTLKKERFYKIFEGIVVCAILVGAAIMRTLYIMDAPVLVNAPFLDAAYVTESSISTLTYGNSLMENLLFVYLRGFMLLFGNIEQIAYYAIMGLQLIAIVIFYCSVRNIAGKTTAVISITFLSFVPDYLKSVSNISTVHIYLLLLTVGVYFISLMIKADRKSVVKWFLLVFSGLFTGLMVSQEFISVSLLLLGILLMIENRTYGKTLKKVFSSFVWLLTAVAGTVIGILVHILVYSGDFTTQVIKFGNGIVNAFYPSLSFIQFSSYYSVMFIVVILLAGWCVSFFFVDSKTIYPIYFWVVIEYILMLCGYGNIEKSHILLVGMSFLAGINVNMFVKQYEKCKLLPVYENEDDEEFDDDYEEPIVDAPIIETPVIDETVSEVPVVEVPIVETPKVQLLRNPLPVPKKHVKKELDYAIQVSDDMMHFDIELSNENDDYDIQ